MYMIENKNRTTHYIRTDKAIVQAFCDLLKLKSYEEITVQDILDKTPISRAAFYQHFLDKEAIGEQLLEEYFELLQTISAEMGLKGEAQYTKIVQAAMLTHSEHVEALRKIHTEKVDLESRLCKVFEEEFLKKSKSKYKSIEAKIYARAMTVYQLYGMENVNLDEAGNPIIYNSVMINSFLKLMRWEDNKEIREYLFSRL